MSTASVHGLRQLRSDWRRFLVCALTLVAGVGLLVASVTSVQDIRRGLAESAHSIQGLGPVSVVPAGTGALLSEADLQALAELPDVVRAIPLASFFTVGRGTDGTDHEINVTGVPVGERPLGVEDAVEGRLPAAGQPETTVPGSLAQRLGIRIGDDLDLATDGTVTTVTVVGVLDEDRTRVYTGNSIFVPLDVAQEASAQGAGFTRVDLQLTPGTEATSWLAAHSASLPVSARPIDIASAASSFAPVLSAVNLVLLLCAGAALLLSAALVAVAFAATARSRTGTYAVLRTVGASPGWLRRTLLWEAAYLGVVASLSGVLVGVGAAALISTVLARLLPIESSGPHLSWWVVAGGLGIGVAACLTGAWAATRTFVTTPVSALLREDAHPARLVSAPRLVLGFLALVLAGGLMLTPWLGSAVVAFALALVAAGLVAPAGLRLASSLPRSRRWPVSVSQQSVTGNQAAGPVVTVMAILLALGVSLSVGVSSIGAAMTDQVTRQFGADVQVTTSYPQDGLVEEAVGDLTGIGAVSSTASGEVDLVPQASDQWRTRTVPVLAIDPASYFESAQLPWVEGSDQTTPDLLRAGSASVVLPVSLADQLDLGVGDEVLLERDGAAVDVEVVATYASLATGMQVVLPRATAAELGVDGATSWNLSLTPGADTQETVGIVRASLQDVPGVHVTTSREMRDVASAELRTYSLIPTAFTVLVVGLGALAVAGLIALDVSTRQRTFGILRAIGGSRAATGAFVLLEGLRYAAVSAVTGTLAGLLAGAALNQVLARALGASTQLTVSPGQIGLMVAGVLALVAAAALPTARRVTLLHPTAVLRTD